MIESSVNGPWREQVQRIRLASFGRGLRLAGFASLSPCSGVSSLCTALAAATAASGVRTLLVDLSQVSHCNEHKPLWLPGSGNAAIAIPRGAQLFDRLTATSTADTRELFNNSGQLRRTLMHELAEYEAIIVDLPPLMKAKLHSIDATSAAAACGNIYLVCVSGRVTKDDLSESVQRLHSAGVEVLGFVLNDVVNPTLGAELAREAMRLGRVAPRLARWLAGICLTNQFLN